MSGFYISPISSKETIYKFGNLTVKHNDYDNGNDCNTDRTFNLPEEDNLPTGGLNIGHVNYIKPIKRQIIYDPVYIYKLRFNERKIKYKLIPNLLLYLQYSDQNQTSIGSTYGKSQMYINQSFITLNTNDPNFHFNNQICNSCNQIIQSFNIKSRDYLQSFYRLLNIIVQLNERTNCCDNKHNIILNLFIHNRYINIIIYTFINDIIKIIN